MFLTVLLASFATVSFAGDEKPEVKKTPPAKTAPAKKPELTATPGVKKIEKKEGSEKEPTKATQPKLKKPDEPKK